MQAMTAQASATAAEYARRWAFDNASYFSLLMLGTGFGAPDGLRLGRQLLAVS